MSKGLAPNGVPDLRPPTAIVFDIGDTLVRATDIAGLALGDAARLVEQQAGADHADFIRAYSDVDTRHDGPSVNHLWSLPLSIMQATCRTLGVSKSCALAAGAVYRSRVRTEIRYDARLVAAFGCLRAAGVKIGIVSDGTTVEQVDTLHVLGLMTHIDSVVISEDVGYAKPSREIFGAVLEELNVTAGSTWYVGDDLEIDYYGAARSSLIPILVGGGPEHARSVRHVADVPHLLEQCSAR